MVYLEHWMPGRARLRVPKPRTPNHVRRVAERVQASKRVRTVSSNPTTGGMLVSFNPEDPIDLIIDDLRAVGLEIASVLDESRVFRTQSTGAVIVRQVFGQANARLHAATQGHFDLRLALPALYLALAMRNLMTQRARLRDASWYQLLYWAFDSFFKLHEELTVKEAARTHGRVVD
jgi:hypothetical protein